MHSQLLSGDLVHPMWDREMSTDSSSDCIQCLLLLLCGRVAPPTLCPQLSLPKQIFELCARSVFE